jgi:hypothetical protein
LVLTCVGISILTFRARACRTLSAGTSGCNRGRPTVSMSACRSTSSTVGLIFDLIFYRPLPGMSLTDDGLLLAQGGG